MLPANSIALPIKSEKPVWKVGLILTHATFIGFTASCPVSRPKSALDPEPCDREGGGQGLGRRTL